MLNSQIRFAMPLATLFLLLCCTHITAQVKVKFNTADGVEIKGRWYASGLKAPVVLILHELGQDGRRREWNELAKRLQKEGFAVLTFDFRGHGQSKVVNAPVFAPLNRGVKILPGGTIDKKHFKNSYVPVLANDIAAAKAFLDEKNDGLECNTSSLILIGAGKGAALGALWLKSEWYRLPVNRVVNAFGRIVKKPNFAEPAGKNVAAAVWFSISGLNGTKKSAERIPRFLGRAAANGMAMTFICNPTSKDEKTMATGCVKLLKPKKAVKFKHIQSHEVAGAGKLTGRRLLLAKGMYDRTEQWLNQLKKDAVFPNWSAQSFKKSESWWYLGPNLYAPATAGDNVTKTFRYLHFARFISAP